MRHFRISLSLQVAFLTVSFLSAWTRVPVRAADIVASLLDKLDPDDRFLIVWVIAADRAQELWLEDLTSTTPWRDTAGSLPTTTLVAEKNRSFLIEFGIEEVPLCLVLDTSGKEVGRVSIGDCTGTPPGLPARRLADLLLAADASQRHAGGVDVRDGDPAALFWIGYFHWSRGERAEALRWFEEYSSLPSTNDEADRELRARALYRQGVHALETGHAEKAAGLFERAIELTRVPERAARCVLARARSLRRLGRPEQAIESIESELRARPPSPLDDRLLFTVGYLYLDLGRRARAREFFARCVAEFPESTYGRKSAHYLRELEEPDTGRVKEGA